MPEPEQAFHYTDYALSMDRVRLFRLGYGGYSTRSELWLVTLLVFILRLCPGLWLLETCPELWVVDALVDILIFYPLFMRRARQMGFTAYGVFAILVSVASMLAFYVLENWENWENWENETSMMKEEVESVIIFYSAVVSIPLYFIGGTYAGRKNGLHRLAMAGDREGCERFLKQFPGALTRRSEKGYSPRDYAARAGHSALAEWFREKEQAQQTAAD